MQKTLIYKEYESNTWFYNGGKDTSKPSNPVKSYFKLNMYFDFKEGLRFTAVAPNVSYCYRNPIKAVLRLLEHESIGMSKYNALKDRIDNLDKRKIL